jgi:hypothetical protein
LTETGNLSGFDLAGTLPRAHCKTPLLLLAWRNRQTRTAQDRMGKPVEVRLLSRAVRAAQRGSQQLLGSNRSRYFALDFLLAAQRAFISSESLLRPAAVSAPLFFAGALLVPPAFLLAAQRAFISCESFRRPAGVS